MPAVGPAEAGPANRHLRVLLLSRTALVRVALRQLLSEDASIMVVGEASTWLEAVAAAARAHPDILVVDVPEQCSVLDRLPELLTVVPGVRVVILSNDPDGAELFAAARAGVWGYLPPDVTAGELLRAVRNVAQGRVALGGALARSDFIRLSVLRREENHTDPPLSPAESRVIRAMSEGQTDGQIASVLGISVPTVKTHVRSILKKTRTKNRAAAIAVAFRRGLLP
jgi:DNA-binding NarL/FixJ family response regulator